MRKSGVSKDFRDNGTLMATSSAARAMVPSG